MSCPSPTSSGTKHKVSSTIIKLKNKLKAIMVYPSALIKINKNHFLMFSAFCLEKIEHPSPGTKFPRISHESSKAQNTGSGMALLMVLSLCGKEKH